MIDGVQVFSATMSRDRVVLDERVTEWLAKTNVKVVDLDIRLSSDHAYHCLTIVVFYRRPV